MWRGRARKLSHTKTPWIIDSINAFQGMSGGRKAFCVPHAHTHTHGYNPNMTAKWGEHRPHRAAPRGQVCDDNDNTRTNTFAHARTIAIRIYGRITAILISAQSDFNKNSNFTASSDGDIAEIGECRIGTQFGSQSAAVATVGAAEPNITSIVHNKKNKLLFLAHKKQQF